MELRIFKVDAETHRAAKILAAEKRITLNEMLIDLIKKGIESVKRDKK